MIASIQGIRIKLLDSCIENWVSILRDVTLQTNFSAFYMAFVFVIQIRGQCTANEDIVIVIQLPFISLILSIDA